MNNKSKRTFSWTAKANHTQIISDDYIKSFLNGCRFPSRPDLEPEKAQGLICKAKQVVLDKKNILTVDGSYTTVKTKKEFPSSEIAFFQFGAILFGTDDLEDLSNKPFISPEDMKNLHNLDKTKLAIPIKNVTSSGQSTLNESIRTEIYKFFLKEKDQFFSLMDTLSWLVFEEYLDTPKTEYKLASNPNIGSSKGEIILKKSEMKSDFTFSIDGGIVYLTDVFRLHEVIDEDFGATGILGYISRAIEQFLLMRFLHVIYKFCPNELTDFIFITNGPLSFSGQTANMHKLFRNACNFLSEKHRICFFGLEKSGPFVDHAQEICRNEENKFYLEKGNLLLLSNSYIYQYITPGDSSRMHYGETSYYGGKAICHTQDGQIYVVTVPIENADIIKNPKLEDYRNLELVIAILVRLKCDMYDDTIVPVALANKLIALTGHPSQVLLEKFARENIKN